MSRSAHHRDGECDVATASQSAARPATRRRAVGIWLYLLAALVIGMVAVGGAVLIGLAWNFVRALA